MKHRIHLAYGSEPAAIRKAFLAMVSLHLAVLTIDPDNTDTNVADTIVLVAEVSLRMGRTATVSGCCRGRTCRLRWGTSGCGSRLRKWTS
eukprot:733278-Rhodomonas_salina.3